MKSQKIKDMIKEKPTWSSEDNSTRFWTGGGFNQGNTWVGQFKGQSPWERHPDGDELIHVLKGKVEITVLTKRGRKRSIVSAGSFFVVPKGNWHRQLAIGNVTEFGATPGKTDHSYEQNPR
jgi:quercetin dioxygenase-like cupin family protein